jgi:predicted O-methyltransferase YrrM
MTQERWTAVDDYLTQSLIPPDAALDAALVASDAAGLPREAVSPTQGKLLHLLARSIGAKGILEIGTLGGYSTIWLARALPASGHLVTLEANATHAEVARTNITNAGLSGIVTLQAGPALESLPTLSGPYDMIFIDADKPNNPAYLEWALKLARPGTLIIGDNVVRDGAVTDPTSADPKVQGVRRFIELIANDPRLDATALQTVGSKGYDGFVLAIVN